jgi:hypothetical protein
VDGSVRASTSARPLWRVSGRVRAAIAAGGATLTVVACGSTGSGSVAGQSATHTAAGTRTGVHVEYSGNGLKELDDIPAIGDGWTLTYTYRCDPSNKDSSFFVDVGDKTTHQDLASDPPFQAPGLSGSGSRTYAAGGRLAMAIDAPGCTWTVTIDGRVPAT